MIALRIKQLLFALFFWAGSFLFLLNLPVFQPIYDNNIACPDSNFLKNEFGAITLTKYDNSRTFTIHFDKLASFSGNFGLFKTAAYKEVIFTNLEIAVATRNEIKKPHLCDALKREKSSKEVLPKEPESAAKDLMSLLDGLKRSIRKNLQSFLQGEVACQTPFTVNFPNCENAAEFTANGFKFSWYDNTNLKYSIESKTANYSLLESSEIQLQGHVILNANGAILESNTVYWDIGNNLFVIKGAYVLNNQGDKKYGRDISVDSQLNRISTITQSNFKEEKVCCLKNQ